MVVPLNQVLAVLPAVTAGPGACALIGMGMAFAGIVRTPLSSVIMNFELSRDYSIIVLLMIQKEGGVIPAGGSREHLKRMRKSDVIEPGRALRRM